jgi:aryl-alcohol dehydrogenase-like predicted oxidoreductase
MEYRLLGRTGVKVSQLCFGVMSFGGDADEKTSAAMFERAREAGINFFDCANVYSQGRAEEILGGLIADCRDQVVITSKVFGAMGNDINARGSSRRNIRAAVEASLRRLKTDYIDVYFLHQFDNETPLEESLRALDDLVQEGKILYPAASNFAAWQYAKALGISQRMGWAPIACIQPMYNLIKRQAEVEILPMAQSEGLGVISYSPLGAGLLTSKYAPGQRPTSGRLVENSAYKSRYREEHYYQVAEQFNVFANEHQVNPASLAVAWVGSHPAITAPIIGARNVEQLEDSLRAVEIVMLPEFRAAISELSPEPPPAHDRSERV